jgi:catechol 2,3-dioxygenase-like lactoylglutathione lyase family enzyme
MITSVALAGIFVTDVDEAKAFYVDKLGFAAGDDITMGDGYRWCTVFHPDHPELHLPLSVPGPPLDPDDAEVVRRLVAKGALGGIGLATDDCRKDAEALMAKGVEFVQEPADRPYGVEAVLRDPSGNWLVMVEPKPYTREDLESAAGCPSS